MARILIADDDAHTVRIMALWLSRHGHTIVEAANGAEAISILKSNAVDFVISDMNMPVVNGFELLVAVREDLKLQVPFLIVSSRCDQAVLATKVAPLNAQVFPKPFVPSRLVAQIQEMLDASVLSEPNR